MRVLYLSVFLILAAIAGTAIAGMQSPPATEGDPDALYRDREQVEHARRAGNIWTARLAANPSDFESAWKLARTMYWLGGRGTETARRKNLEAGMEAARKAVALQPNRPEGHFWLAADMGAFAELAGMRAGLKYRRPIKDSLETVLRLDPSFQKGSADRALGRWYYRVPGLFGGSKSKSEGHLRRSLEYHPTSTASLFFLAETLVALDRVDDARATLQKLDDAPTDPEWAPEDREFKAKGRALAKRIS
jgi:hypothetical protein